MQWLLLHTCCCCNVSLMGSHKHMCCSALQASYRPQLIMPCFCPAVVPCILLTNRGIS